MSIHFELELLNGEPANCFYGGFVLYLDALDLIKGAREKTPKLDGYLCQIDNTIPCCIISQKLLNEVLPKGHTLLAKNSANKYIDPAASYQPRPNDGEIILDFVFPISARVSNVPFVIDENAEIPIRIGKQILDLFMISYTTKVVDGVEKQFVVFDRE